MAQREVSEAIVKGHRLSCPLCKGKRFWQRKTLMNTAGLSFFGWEFANKAAKNYVCDGCGYVYWFLE